jgi:hypothetical protein
LASIPQSLTESEDEALGASVNILREAIHSLGLS